MSHDLLRWDPFDDFRTMKRVMDRVFPNPQARDAEPASFSELALPVDIYERENKVVIKAAVPGVKPEDVKITVAENVLTIEAETQADADVKEGDFHRREHRYGRWTRTFRLPNDLDVERAAADFEHGVLRLTLPRKAEARPKTFTVPVTARA